MWCHQRQTPLFLHRAVLLQQPLMPNVSYLASICASSSSSSAAAASSAEGSKPLKPWQRPAAASVYGGCFRSQSRASSASTSSSAASGSGSQVVRGVVNLAAQLPITNRLVFRDT